MTSSSELRQCRVCGLVYEDYFPWGEDGESATFDICDCCGTEFGYEDAWLTAIRRARQAWVEKGGTWRDPTRKLEGWSMAEQLASIPEKWR